MNVNISKAIEEPDRYILPLAGIRVSRLYLDFGFGMLFWEKEPRLEIRIEAKMRFFRNTERHIVADPANPESLGPLLALFGRTVTLAHAFKDGRLRVEFEQNTRLEVDAGEKYEPWKVVSGEGLHGLRVVSVPGGSLAFWQANPK